MVLPNLCSLSFVRPKIDIFYHLPLIYNELHGGAHYPPKRVPPPITTRLHYKVRSKIRTFYHLDNFLCLFFNSFINYGRIK